MALLPQFPVQEAGRLNFGKPLIQWFIRMRQSIEDLIVQDPFYFEDDNMVLVTDADGKPTTSTNISTTELGYLDGVTSNVQTQIGTKLNISASSSNICYEDALPRLASFKTAGATVPPFTQVGTSPFWGYEFDNALVAAEKRDYVEIQFPHGYKPGSDIETFHLHLMVTSIPATNEVVRFTFEYSWVSNFAQAPAPTTIIGTATIASTYAASAGQPYLLILSFPVITGTGQKESSIMGGTLRRTSSHADDTYTGSVWVVDLDAHFKKEKGGTPNEWPS